MLVAGHSFALRRLVVARRGLEVAAAFGFVPVAEPATPRAAWRAPARVGPRPGLRDRLRVLSFFTPWVSIPLALLGIESIVCFPLALLVGFGWISYVAAVVSTVAFAVWLRPRYRMSTLDSSHAGVFVWFRRRY